MGAALLGLGVQGCGARAPSPPGSRPGEGLVYLAGGTFRMGSREGGPEAPPREVSVGPFWIGRYEVTVSEFAAFLNRSTEATFRAETPQIERKNGRFAPRRGKAREPAAYVSLREAEAYCRGLSAEWGCRVRLPTEAEWEFAARGGIPRARYPWGWGDPKGRAQFSARGAAKVGSYPPNAFGLFDMAGNVFEWCLPGEDAPPDSAPARGGSWAERNPARLCVYRRTWFPRAYRDADVGFRIVVEYADAAREAGPQGVGRAPIPRARRPCWRW